MTPCLLRAGLLAVHLSVLGAAPAARAEGELRSGIRKVAQQVHAFLKEQGEETISLGQFTGPANFPSSAGPGLDRMLSEELAKLGVTVKKRAKFALKGGYTGAAIDDPDTAGKKQLVVVLKGEIVDGLGKRHFGIDSEVSLANEQAMAEFLGVTVSLPPRATDKDRREKTKDAAAEPKTTDQGAAVFAGPGSPYGVELIVDGRPGTPADGTGVPLRGGQRYGLRLHNRSDQEVAVALAVDGLSVFAFAAPDAAGRSSGRRFLFVRPGGDVEVRGWFRTAADVEPFRAGVWPESAATLTRLTGTGAVTAAFYASRKESARPAEERPADGRGDGARGKPVRRAVRELRAVVTVPYGTASDKEEGEPSRPPITAIAEKLRAFLQGEGEGDVMVAPIDGPAGPGVRRLLCRALAEQGVAVKQRAALGVRAVVTAAPGGTESKPALTTVRAEVTDALGKRYLVFDFEAEGVDPPR